jgi:FOG: LysM repeat
MGNGFLYIRAAAFGGALPVVGAKVKIFDMDGSLLYELMTNECGLTKEVSLSAPPVETQFDPNYEGHPYSRYIVDIIADGYQETIVKGVQIYDKMPSVLPVDMKAGNPSDVDEYNIGDNALELDSTNQDAPTPADMLAASRIHREVFIPTHITVHLGAPASSARNVTVPFIDYIKNVASSEIYPSWPYQSLRANIHAIISIALNRVFTEWYRGKGYNFDITNNTQYDQYFVEGRNIYESVSVIADEIFNTYVVRPPGAEPYFTEYCSGSNVTCPGMKQWGTVDLANQGMNYLQILRYYYGQSVYVASTNNIQTPFESFPGNLALGSQGQDVAMIQMQLARIRQNYPRIPALSVDGQYGSQTVAAVREFQTIFGISPTGTVDRSTWYRISNIYVAVMRLAELGSEGHRPPDVTPPVPPAPPADYFNYTVVAGDSLWLIAQKFGTTVDAIMSLNGLTSTNLTIGQVLKIPSSSGGADYFNYTVVAGDSLWQIAQKFGTTVDAIMSLNGLTSTNLSIGQVLKIPSSGGGSVPRPPFPGTLRLGSRGSNVTILQQNLNRVAAANSAIPRVATDGIFGAGTQQAVRAFQSYYGLASDGIVGQLTWNRLMDLQV